MAKAWFKNRLNDHFLKKSRQEAFRSRAAYKLEEIDQKYKILKPGQSILDLGAAPGSWSQYAVRALKGRGKVIAIDLLRDMAPDTTGVHYADTENSAQLVHLALDIAEKLLKPNGSFVAKVFEGAEYKELLQRTKSLFGFAKSFNPKASLNRSRELFLVAQNFKKK
jgi:23S rRNA (uridine2552-2'-O)-methyltransferase